MVGTRSNIGNFVYGHSSCNKILYGKNDSLFDVKGSNCISDIKNENGILRIKISNEIQSDTLSNFGITYFIDKRKERNS